jgi:hypothetical protein
MRHLYQWAILAENRWAHYGRILTMLHRYVPKELLTKLEPVRELGGMVGDRTSRCCLWASLSDKTTHPYGSLQRLTVV